jgi:hypothetical protein
MNEIIVQRIRDGCDLTVLQAEYVFPDTVRFTGEIKISPSDDEIAPYLPKDVCRSIQCEACGEFRDIPPNAKVPTEGDWTCQDADWENYDCSARRVCSNEDCIVHHPPPPTTDDFTLNIKDFRASSEHEGFMEDSHGDILDENFYTRQRKRTKGEIDPEKVKQISLMMKAKYAPPVDSSRSVLCYGKVQTGKSKMQFVIMWFQIFCGDGTGVIHVLQNNRLSLEQNIKRDYADFRKEVHGFCKEIGIDESEWQNYIFDYIPNPTKIARKNTVYVCIANPIRLNNLASYSTSNPVCIIVDESDAVVKTSEGGMTMTERAFDNMAETARKFYLFTATPFANLNRLNFFTELYVLPVPEGYRFSTSEKIKKHFVDQSLFQNTDQIVDLLHDEIFQIDFGDFPSVTLVNFTKYQKKMGELKTKIIRKMGQENVHVIVFNSDEHTFLGKEFHVMGEMFTEIGKNFYEGGDKRPVVIISGNMAGRAVSFRCSNKGRSMLTSMIYETSDASNEAAVIQAQRLSGVYAEDVPCQHLYCTEKMYRDIESADKNVQAFVEQILNSKNCVSTREALRGTVILDTKRKFDREAVDDTKRQKVQNVFYDTRSEVEKSFRGRFEIKKVVVLTDTERVGAIPLPASQEFKYGKEIRSIRNQAVEEIRKKYVDCDWLPDNKGYHVCWNNERFNTLFDIERRIKHEHYRVCAVTFGDPHREGSQTKMPYVTWKPEYHDITKCNEEGVLYLFMNTRGQWGGYLPRKMKELKVLAHE